MSTRGAVGFYKNGKEKVGYNHSDSYPSELGNEILKYIKSKTIEELNTICDEIKLLDSEEDKRGFDWKEGKINSEFEDCKDFLADSLFCEYAYIINLDTGMLEFYEGYNKNPDAKGRYASLSSEEGYYGVVLKQEIPLESIFKGKASVFEDYGFVFER